MKRLLMLIPLVFLCCMGCQQGEEVAAEDVEEDIQTIKDIVKERNSATNDTDVERFMELYAEEAIKILPNEPALIGKEAIRNWIQGGFDELSLQEENEILDVKVSGDLATAFMSWSCISAPKTGGKSSKDGGNWIGILQRQPDGAWKIIYRSHSIQELS